MTRFGSIVMTHSGGVPPVFEQSRDSLPTRSCTVVHETNPYLPQRFPTADHCLTLREAGIRTELGQTSTGGTGSCSHIYEGPC